MERKEYLPVKTQYKNYHALIIEWYGGTILAYLNARFFSILVFFMKHNFEFF